MVNNYFTWELLILYATPLLSIWLITSLLSSFLFPRNLLNFSNRAETNGHQACLFVVKLPGKFFYDFHTFFTLTWRTDSPVGWRVFHLSVVLFFLLFAFANREIIFFLWLSLRAILQLAFITKRNVVNNRPDQNRDQPSPAQPRTNHKT